MSVRPDPRRVLQRAGGETHALLWEPSPCGQARLAAARALPGPFIDIDTPTFDRLFLGPPPAAFTEVTVPFSEKGRYVVVCTFEPHLADGMYGWVNVQ